MKEQGDSNWNIYILQKKNVMAMHQQFVSVCIVFTTQAQCKQDKVIGVGLSSYITCECVCEQLKLSRALTIDK